MAEVGIQITAQNATQNAFQQLQRDIQRSNEHLEQIAENTRRVVRETQPLTRAQQTIRSLRNQYRNLQNDIGNAAIVTQRLSVAFSRQARAVVDAAVNYDRLRRSLETISGSAEFANAQFERLIEVSRLPGINLEQALRASVQLQAIGQSGAQAAEAITQFGNALALGGGSARDINQITNAIRQMSAEGRILQEDLSILTTRLAVLVPVLREEFNGVRAADIRRYFDSLNVAQSDQATEFLRIIIRRLSELPRAGETAANAIENLSDSIERAQASIGTQLLPAIQDSVATIERLVMSLENADPAVQRTIAGISVFGTAFVTLTAAATGFTVALPALAGAVTFLAANPIGLAITATTALAAAFISAELQASRFRAEIGRTQRVLRTSIQAGRGEDQQAIQSSIESLQARQATLQRFVDAEQAAVQAEFDAQPLTRRGEPNPFRRTREDIEAANTTLAAYQQQLFSVTTTIEVLQRRHQRLGEEAEDAATAATDAVSESFQALTAVASGTDTQIAEQLQRFENATESANQNVRDLALDIGNELVNIAEATTEDQVRAANQRVLAYTRDNSLIIEGDENLKALLLAAEVAFQGNLTDVILAEQARRFTAGQQQAIIGTGGEIQAVLSNIRNPDTTPDQLREYRTEFDGLVTTFESLGGAIPNLQSINSEIDSLINQRTTQGIREAFGAGLTTELTDANTQIGQLLANIRSPDATPAELVSLNEQLEGVFEHLDSLGIVVPNLAQIRSEVSGIVGEATDDQLSGLAETTLRNQERTFADARQARDDHNQREEQAAQNAIDGLNRQQESARRRRQRDEDADRREREQAAREHQRRLQRIAAESADIIANTFQLDTSPLFATLATGLEVAIRQGVGVLPEAFAQQLDALLPIIGPFFTDFFGGLFESLSIPDNVNLGLEGAQTVGAGTLFGGGAALPTFGTGFGVATDSPFAPDRLSLDGLTVNISPESVDSLAREQFTRDDLIDIYERYRIPHNLELTANNTRNTADNTIDISRLSSILQASQTDLRGVIELLQREPETSPLQDFIDNRQGILRIFGNDEFRGLVSEFVVANTQAAERQQELLQEQRLQEEDPEAFQLLQNLETLFSNVAVDPSVLPPSGIEGLLDESGIFQSFDGLIARIREALLFPLSPEARADLLGDLETVFSVLPILPETATSFLEQLATQLSETELQVDPDATVEAVLSPPQLQAIVEAGAGVTDLGAGGLQNIFAEAGVFDLGAASLIEQLNNVQASLNQVVPAPTPGAESSDVFSDINEREAGFLSAIDSLETSIADAALGLSGTDVEADRESYQQHLDFLNEELVLAQAQLEGIRRSREELELFFGIVSDATTAVESFAIGAEAAGASPFASLTGIVDEFQRLLGLSDTGQDFTALTTHIRNALTGPQLSVDTFESFRGAAGRAFDEAGLTTSDNAVIAEQARLFLENLSGIDINPESLNQLAMMYPDTVGINGVVTTAPEGGAMTINPEGGSLTVNPEGDSMNVMGLMEILGIPTVNIASMPPVNINIQTFGGASDDSTQDQLIHQTGGTLSAG